MKKLTKKQIEKRESIIIKAVSNLVPQSGILKASSPELRKQREERRKGAEPIGRQATNEILNGWLSEAVLTKLSSRPGTRNRGLSKQEIDFNQYIVENKINVHAVTEKEFMRTHQPNLELIMGSTSIRKFFNKKKRGNGKA